MDRPAARSRFSSFAGLLPLLALACSPDGSAAREDNRAKEDHRAQEIACQQRLVSLPEQVRLTGGGERLGDAFDRLRGLYEAMPLEGCLEGQRARVPLLAAHSGRLAAAARRLGNPASLRDVAERQQDPSQSAALLEFMSEIEGWTNRNRAMREDLERMQAAARP